MPYDVVTTGRLSSQGDLDDEASSVYTSSLTGAADNGSVNQPTAFNCPVFVTLRYRYS